MAITKLTKDMDIIQKLGDEPNDVDGLSSSELKAKFDEGNNAMKDWVNNTFIPEVEQALADTDGKAANAVETVNEHALSKANPHGVTAEQAGARPNTWFPTAEETGAARADLANVSNEDMKKKVEDSGFGADLVAGVSSFNGRQGAVVPQAGDYTAADVGARPDTWMPTAADVGAVSRAGDVMFGPLAIQGSTLNVNTDRGEISANIFTYDWNAQFRNRRDDNTFSTLILPDGNTDNPMLYVKQRNGATVEVGNILHTGNKPSGLYIGNGSAAERVMDLGGFHDDNGSWCGLWGGAGEAAMVCWAGAFYRVDGTTVGFTHDITFINGVLTFKTATILNTNSYQYQYCVL